MQSLSYPYLFNIRWSAISALHFKNHICLPCGMFTRWNICLNTGPKIYWCLNRWTSPQHDKTSMMGPERFELSISRSLILQTNLSAVRFNQPKPRARKKHFVMISYSFSHFELHLKWFWSPLKSYGFFGFGTYFRSFTSYSIDSRFLSISGEKSVRFC